MIEAVIFDMDGTMFDTEGLWKDINFKLAEQYNIVFDPEIRVKMMGRNDHDSLTVFKEHYQIDDSIENIISARRKLILEDTDKVVINKGLIELINLLDELEIKKAIATSSFNELTYKLVDKFGLRNEFGTIVTGDDIKESKPNPEIFLKAAAIIKVNPTNCLVIEDAQNGIEAAYNAGMKSIAISHIHSSSHDFSKADKILSSMLEINEELIRSL